jgi:hypothetical protein
MKKTAIAAVLLAVGACATGPLVSSAQASTLIPYPTTTPDGKHVENLATYTFTASNDGAVTAYFAGSAAHFIEVLGMTVNGIPTGITGLNDQLSHIGDSLILANNVHAGDRIVFFDQVSTQNTGDIWYSDPALNPIPDGQHVYATPYDSNSHLLISAIPSGLYVGFEDLRRALGSNFDYQDETFVVTNVATNATPLPAALPLFATGVGGLALLGWRRKRKSASIAAE